MTDRSLLSYLLPEDIAWLRAHGATWLVDQMARPVYGLVARFDAPGIVVENCTFEAPVCEHHEWQRIDTFDSFKIREFCSRCELDK